MPKTLLFSIDKRQKSKVRASRVEEEIKEVVAKVEVAVLAEVAPCLEVEREEEASKMKMRKLVKSTIRKSMKSMKKL